MKGIILAGGSGTRLYPVTLTVNKQLLPIYDKPMIYYPLATLMNAGISEILIISTPLDLPRIKQLLGDGQQLGCRFSYQIQEQPRGLAEAFILGEEFIGSDKVAMILGDNIFYGSEINDKLSQYANPDGGVVFGYQVADPERYGVVEFDKKMKALSIEEKPLAPKSNLAQVGLYLFDHRVFDLIGGLHPSGRGELEITDVTDAYRRANELVARPVAGPWWDVGSFEGLSHAAEYFSKK